MTAIAQIRDAAGLDEYLDELERRLARAAARHPGAVAAIGHESLGAGGKRLRPLLAFLCAPPDAEPPYAAGVALELMHMATLVHDDVIDRAQLRRGRTTAWAAHGADAARATGDYLFGCAFAEIAATGDVRAVAALADTALCLVRGEALQRRQTRDPRTAIDAYLMRCALKTGKLFEAACLLGSGRARLAEFGLALGIAFQIVDDILDCSGITIETGKVPGTDLREGTPTLPLLLAAQQDAYVRAALAGVGPLDGALVRVAETGALERSRAIALEYARKARNLLDGEPRTAELEALTHIVIDRER